MLLENGQDTERHEMLTGEPAEIASEGEDEDEGGGGLMDNESEGKNDVDPDFSDERGNIRDQGTSNLRPESPIL